MSEVYSKLLTPNPDLVAQCLKATLDRRVDVTGVGAQCDMWVTDRSVPGHTDRQPPGFWTYLWILVNGLDLYLREATQGVTLLPVGTLLRFDGSQFHGAMCGPDNKGAGKFAFLAWDMPHEQYSLDDFYKELQEKRA